jgi:hypothetical protein
LGIPSPGKGMCRPLSAIDLHYIELAPFDIWPSYIPGQRNLRTPREYNALSEDPCELAKQREQGHRHRSMHDEVAVSALWIRAPNTSIMRRKSIGERESPCCRPWRGIVGLTPTGVQRPETRSLARLIPRPDRGPQSTLGCGPPSRCAY